MPWIWSFPTKFHEQNNTDPSFPSSWLGSAHFQLRFINKTMQIPASRSTGPGPAHVQSHFMNKTIHIQASKSTGLESAHIHHILLTNNTDPSLQIHWPWICSFPITISWTKHCKSQPPDPLALDLLISNHISLTNNTDPSLQTHWPWICSYPSHFINKQYRSKPPNPLALNLVISNHISFTNQSRSGWRWSWLLVVATTSHQPPPPQPATTTTTNHRSPTWCSPIPLGGPKIGSTFKAQIWVSKDVSQQLGDTEWRPDSWPRSWAPKWDQKKNMFWKIKRETRKAITP